MLLYKTLFISLNYIQNNFDLNYIQELIRVSMRKPLSSFRNTRSYNNQICKQMKFILLSLILIAITNTSKLLYSYNSDDGLNLELYLDNQDLLTVAIDSVSQSFNNEVITYITNGALTTAVELANFIIEYIELPSQSNKVDFGRDDLTIFYEVLSYNSIFFQINKNGQKKIVSSVFEVPQREIIGIQIIQNLCIRELQDLNLEPDQLQILQDNLNYLMDRISVLEKNITSPQEVIVEQQQSKIGHQCTFVQKTQQQFEEILKNIITYIPMFSRNPYHQCITINGNTLKADCGLTNWYGIRSDIIANPSGSKKFQFRFLSGTQFPRPNVVFGITAQEGHTQFHWDNVKGIGFYLTPPDGRIRTYGPATNLMPIYIQPNDVFGMIVDYDTSTVRFLFNNQPIEHPIRIDTSKMPLDKLRVYIDFHALKVIEFLG